MLNQQKVRFIFYYLAIVCPIFDRLCPLSVYFTDFLYKSRGTSYRGQAKGKIQLVSSY